MKQTLNLIPGWMLLKLVTGNDEGGRGNREPGNGKGSLGTSELRYPLVNETKRKGNMRKCSGCKREFLPRRLCPQMYGAPFVSKLFISVMCNAPYYDQGSLSKGGFIKGKAL